MSSTSVAYSVVFLVDDAERRLMHFPTMDAAMAVARSGQVIVSGVFERTSLLGLAWNTTAQTTVVAPVARLSQTSGELKPLQTSAPSSHTEETSQ